MEVGLHVLEYQVQIAIVLCPDNSLQPDDVGMAQLLQYHYLSVCALSICRVLESIEIFLQGKLPMSFLIDDFPYVAVCSTPNQALHPIQVENMSVDLFAHPVEFKYYSYSTANHEPKNSVKMRQAA